MESRMVTARLERFSRTAHQLALHFSVGDLHFATTYWYAETNLLQLEACYGTSLLQQLYAHIALFEMSKFYSLRARCFHLGPLHGYVTAALRRLFDTVVARVFAQWRYEHDESQLPSDLIAEGGDSLDPAPVEVVAGPVATLLFCGGGKDSLVAMRLLDHAQLPYATHGYSHSIYGSAGFQHALIGGLLKHGQPVRHHRSFVFDDFLDAPVLQLQPELQAHSLLAAETPCSLFAALPLALAHGYRSLVLAHERSANFGNLRWDKTGEEVNHQWGKSIAAEQLLASYVQQELLSNVQYFSLLMPIYDAVIFTLLRRDVGALRDTHSCNIRKPWCKRCAKCAYVWLGYMAYLPTEEVSAMFGENLLDLPENQVWFEQLLGLSTHTPFECVGRVEEARLMMLLCQRKGLQGRAMALLQRLSAVDIVTEAQPLLGVYDSLHRIPEPIRSAVLLQMNAASADALTLLRQAT